MVQAREFSRSSAGRSSARGESVSGLSDSEDSRNGAAVELLWSMVVVLVYVGVGTAVLCLLEGYGPITALYITIQVTTTIGYGDVTSDTVRWKVFMVFYIIFGIAIVANILNSVFSYFLDASMEHARETMRHVEQNLDDVASVEDASLRRSRRALASSAVILLALVLVWATLFWFVEPCSCSYGRTYIDGCIEDSYEQCVKTGGRVKDWGSNLYFAIVTFSTVGFGSYSLQSRLGRGISIILMPIGVLAFLNFVTSISQVIGCYKSFKEKKERPASNILKWVDKDDNGKLDEQQFMVYYLVKEGIIQKQDIERISDLFNSLDKRDVGALTYDTNNMTIEGVDVDALHAH